MLIDKDGIRVRSRVARTIVLPGSRDQKTGINRYEPSAPMKIRYFEAFLSCTYEFSVEPASPWRDCLGTAAQLQLTTATAAQLQLAVSKFLRRRHAAAGFTLTWSEYGREAALWRDAVCGVKQGAITALETGRYHCT